MKLINTEHINKYLNMQISCLSPIRNQNVKQKKIRNKIDIRTKNKKKKREKKKNQNVSIIVVSTIDYTATVERKKRIYSNSYASHAAAKKKEAERTNKRNDTNSLLKCYIKTQLCDCKLHFICNSCNIQCILAQYWT